MRDETLIRLAADANEKLAHVRFPATTPYLAPAYNAVLAAAQANHPEEVFFMALTPITKDEAGPEEMNVLFGQLRIVLEALVEERNQDREAPPPPPRYER